MVGPAPVIECHERQHVARARRTNRLHVLLRAERNGGGSGRIYTVTITCTDTAGSSSDAAVTVTVAHDQGHG
ncbi:MAG TPA: hypothetical protein VGQ28_15760 [Thermoanaerobaculia bacterium]|nr:hypothetical protein [Thermoanaerobaculia bacterium]